MPIFEYECIRCKNIDEHIVFRDIGEFPCSKCKSTAVKIVSLSNFKLKGPGWAKHGYDKKNVNISEDGPLDAIEGMIK